MEQVEYRFTATKDFEIKDRRNTIHKVKEGALIVARPPADPWCGLAAEVTVVWSTGQNSTMSYTIETELDINFQKHTKEIDNAPKSVDLSPKTIVGVPHLQVKTFDSEGELNEFLANRPESDIVSVTPFLISTESYLGMRFSVLYKVL